ncbi:hypothetical protein F4680DRAFT_428450 [Xylaria scruposa]|nr:hypothetical protein F4680DRAFT_428450 [Xylaria scruposa]
MEAHFISTRVSYYLELNYNDYLAFYPLYILSFSIPIWWSVNSSLAIHTTLDTVVMILLQKLVWHILSGITFSQGTSEFIEFLAPQENEAIVAGSTYIIRWAATSSNGNGTMTLLGGQTSESLSNIWEIADFIDVAGGSFSWPVIGFPTPGGLFALYGFNFSLEGNQNMFSISPPFNIVSTRRRDTRDSGKYKGDDHDTDTDDDDDGDDIFPLPPPLANAAPTSIEPPPVISSSESSLDFVSPVPTEVSTSTSSNGHSTSSRHSSNIPSPTQSPVPGPKMGSGAIAGTVVGATTALVAFSSLIGLVLYYRRRLLSGERSSNPEQRRGSKIDGIFRKAELDAEGSQVKITRLYELDATREVQEADGRMKPAELDSNVLGSKSHAANAQDDSM